MWVIVYAILCGFPLNIKSLSKKNCINRNTDIIKKNDLAYYVGLYIYLNCTKRWIFNLFCKVFEGQGWFHVQYSKTRKTSL